MDVNEIPDPDKYCLQMTDTNDKVCSIGVIKDVSIINGLNNSTNRRRSGRTRWDVEEQVKKRKRKISDDNVNQCIKKCVRLCNVNDGEIVKSINPSDTVGATSIRNSLDISNQNGVDITEIPTCDSSLGNGEINNMEGKSNLFDADRNGRESLNISQLDYLDTNNDVDSCRCEPKLSKSEIITNDEKIGIVADTNENADADEIKEKITETSCSTLNNIKDISDRKTSEDINDNNLEIISEKDVTNPFLEQSVSNDAVISGQSNRTCSRFDFNKICYYSSLFDINFVDEHKPDEGNINICLDHTKFIETIHCENKDTDNVDSWNDPDICLIGSHGNVNINVIEDIELWYLKECEVSVNKDSEEKCIKADNSETKKCVKPVAFVTDATKIIESKPTEEPNKVVAAINTNKINAGKIFKTKASKKYYSTKTSSDRSTNHNTVGTPKLSSYASTKIESEDTIPDTSDAISSQIQNLSQDDSAVCVVFDNKSTDMIKSDISFSTSVSNTPDDNDDLKIERQADLCDENVSSQTIESDGDKKNVLDYDQRTNKIDVKVADNAENLVSTGSVSDTSHMEVLNSAGSHVVDTMCDTVIKNFKSKNIGYPTTADTAMIESHSSNTDSSNIEIIPKVTEKVSDEQVTENQTLTTSNEKVGSNVESPVIPNRRVSRRLLDKIKIKVEGSALIDKVEKDSAESLQPISNDASVAHILSIPLPSVSNQLNKVDKIKVDREYDSQSTTKNNQLVLTNNSNTENLDEKNKSSFVDSNLIPVPIEESAVPHPFLKESKSIINDEVINDVSSSVPTNYADPRINEDILNTFEQIDECEYHVERSICKEAKRVVCDCFLTPEELERGENGCGEDCLNRLLLIECGSRCALGDHCSNKRFQNNQYVPCEVFNAETKGYGLRSLGFIPRGTFIIEYVGEIVDSNEFSRRVDEYSEDPCPHHYFMSFQSDYIIDATVKGNVSRFINHSCDPNSETQKWTVNGELRIGFFTRRDIQPGEEITFDYHLQRYGRAAQKCMCKSALCRGWIGVEGDNQEDDDKSDSRVNLTIIADTAGKWESILDDITETGLVDRDQTLNLNRMMLYVKSLAARLQILKLIQEANSVCKKLFIDYHGLTLLWSWMVDCNSITDPAECDNFKMQLLKVLDSLNITNRTLLTDSKVLPVVEQWANSLMPLESSSSNLLNVENIPLPGASDDLEDYKSTKGVAKKLLNIWSSLRDTFRIPKKERIIQMKEHEMEADRNKPIIQNSKSRTNKVGVITSVLKSSKYGVCWDETRNTSSRKRRWSDRLPRRPFNNYQTDAEHDQTEMAYSSAAYDESYESEEYKQPSYPTTHNENISVLTEAVNYPPPPPPVETDNTRNVYYPQTVTSYVPQAPPYSNIPGFVPYVPPPQHYAQPMQPYPYMQYVNPIDPGYMQPAPYSQQPPPPPMQYMQPPQPVQYIQTSQPMQYMQPEQYSQPATYQYGVQPTESYPGVQYTQTTPLSYDPSAQYHHPENTDLKQPINVQPEEAVKIYYENQDLIQSLISQTNKQKPGSDQGISAYIPPDELQNIPLPDKISNESVKPSRQSSRFDEAPKCDSSKLYDPLSAGEASPEANSNETSVNEEVTNLPPKWRSAKDAKGRVYYYHVKTKVPQWHPPRIEQLSAENSPNEFVVSDSEGDSTSEQDTNDYLINSNSSNKMDKDIQENLQAMSAEFHDTDSEGYSPVDGQKNLEIIQKYAEGLIIQNIRKSNIKKKHNLKDKHKKPRVRFDTTVRMEAVTSADYSAAADTSSVLEHRIKENFRSAIAGYIVFCLKPYYQENCNQGRITNESDFKHLARKLTYFVMVKEQQQCGDATKLSFSNSVKRKTKNYIRKYMAKYGECYIKPPSDPHY